MSHLFQSLVQRALFTMVPINRSTLVLNSKLRFAAESTWGSQTAGLCVLLDSCSPTDTCMVESSADIDSLYHEMYVSSVDAVSNPMFLNDCATSFSPWKPLYGQVILYILVCDVFVPNLGTLRVRMARGRERKEETTFRTTERHTQGELSASVIEKPFEQSTCQ